MYYPVFFQCITQFLFKVILYCSKQYIVPKAKKKKKNYNFSIRNGLFKEIGLQ